MGERKRKLLFVVLAALVVCLGLTLNKLDPEYKKIIASEESVIKGDRKELMVQLPSQFLVASMTGFKDIVAGALWVRADEFFHRGEFQAIIPIVRMVTWLDPHNIDVYTTGAWHMDYNFVDEQQMSDKRYIPAAIGLLKEGIKHNPDTWELYFELGWTHYNRKLLDYEGGLKYMEEAGKRHGYDPNTGRAIARPGYVDNMIAHQYELVGRYKDAAKQWEKARDRMFKEFKSKRQATFADISSIDVCDRNLALLHLRQAYRYGDMEAYRKGVKLYQEMAKEKRAADDVKRSAQYAAADYAKRLEANNPPGDALKPLDAGFEVTWKKAAPKVLLIKGKINLIQASEYKGMASEIITNWYSDNEKLSADKKKLWRDGARVYWKLTDADYEMPSLDVFNWKIDTDQTVIWDDIFVSGGTFSRTLDFSRNPDFYPFKAKQYKLTITVRPEQPGCPDFIQDRIGWKGEGLTDKNYLDTKSRPGYRILKKEFILDRSDIM